MTKKLFFAPLLNNTPKYEVFLPCPALIFSASQELNIHPFTVIISIRL